MKILCGTDLSKNSHRSIAAANALATRFNDPLDVVHVMHSPLTERMATAVREMHEQECHDGLAEVAEQLDSRGDRAHTHLMHGHADEELVKLADDKDVGLVVVGSLGESAGRHWLLGSCAERVAEASPKPTLIVRDELPFMKWSERRPLMVMVAWSFDETGEKALRWIADWRKHGPVEITVAHIDWPPEEARRLGVTMDTFSTHNDPLVQKVLERDIRERVEEILGGPVDHVIVEGDYGRSDFHFAHIANERRPDLVVCGTHQRHGFGRLAHQGFSRGLLHHCHSSVLIVPQVLGGSVSIPRMRNVLVTTDFSEVANHAIPTAYAQVDAGGTVHLLHVVDPFFVPEDIESDEMKSAKNLLAGLVPVDAGKLGINTEIHVVEGSESASAICQCAERFGVDLICMGSHGRGGLSNLMAGSVADAVIRRTHRPVTVVKPPERS